jgi:hypothetical protein
LLFGLALGLALCLACASLTWGALAWIHRTGPPEAYTIYGCIVVGSSPGSAAPTYVSLWVQSGGGWLLAGERTLMCDSLPWAPILPKRIEIRVPP